MQTHDRDATMNRLQEQYANRQILIEDLRTGRYQKLQGGWADESGEKVCIMGTACETARQRIYPEAGLLPMKQAVKHSEHDLNPAVVITRTYNFGLWNELCLIMKSELTDTTMPGFADHIERLPPPSLPNFAKRIIIRLSAKLGLEFENAMDDGPERSLAGQQHTIKPKPTVAEAKTDDRPIARHGAWYWRRRGNRYRHHSGRPTERPAQTARRP